MDGFRVIHSTSRSWLGSFNGPFRADLVEASIDTVHGSEALHLRQGGAFREPHGRPAKLGVLFLLPLAEVCVFFVCVCASP